MSHRMKRSLPALLAIVLLQGLFLPTAYAAGPPKEFDEEWNSIFKDAAGVQEYFDDQTSGNYPSFRTNLQKGLLNFAASVVSIVKNNAAVSRLEAPAPGESGKTKLAVINDWLNLCVAMDQSLPTWQLSLSLGKQAMAKQFEQNAAFDYKTAIANGNADLTLSDMFYYVLGRGPVEQGYSVGNPCLIAAADATLASQGLSTGDGALLPYFGGSLTSSYKPGKCFFQVDNCQPAMKAIWVGTPDAEIVNHILQSTNQASKLVKQYTDELAKTPVPAAAPPTTPKTANDQILSGSVLTLPLPLGDISLPNLIARVIKQVLSIVGALALLFFVWGGFKWMMAGGAPDKIAEAKKIIIAAISGLAAIFLSYAILDFIIKAISSPV